MNSAFDQNHIEALLALEQLETQIGQKGFRHELQRLNELLKSMKLSSEEQKEFQERLNALQERQNSWQSEQSRGLLESVQQKLDQARALMQPVEPFETQQAHFQQAYDVLESLHHLLEFERFNLTRQDRDASWEQLKACRYSLREARNAASAQVASHAEMLFAQAQKAVESQRFREAKESFQALQKEVNQLPLQREARAKFRERFNTLWEQLQAQGKQQREAAQQRRAEGLRKLEDALHRVESFIVRKEQEIKQQEQRAQEAHWNEVDPLEKQLAKDKEALEDSRRRQSELKAKIEDARSRNK